MIAIRTVGWTGLAVAGMLTLLGAGTAGANREPASPGTRPDRGGLADASSVAYLPLVQRSTAPAVIGTVNPETASQVVYAGNRAYLLVDALRPGLARVLVVDVTDPSAPRRIGATDPLPLPVWTIAADGDRLYALACECRSIDWNCAGSLYVYGTAGSGSPTFLVEWPLPFHLRQVAMADLPTTHWMASSGSVVYLATGGPPPDPTVRILETRDPAHVRELGQIALPGIEAYVTHADGYLYLSGPGVTTMTVADVRDPTRPHVVARVPVIGTEAQIAPVLVAVHGRTAYAVTGVGDYGPSGVRAFDVTEPWRPRVLGEVGGRIQGPFGVAATAQRLYVVDGWDVAIYDVSRRTAPVPVGVQGAFQAADVATGGDDGPVYVADERTGLVTFRWRDLEVPSGAYSTLGESKSAATIGSLAYVASDNGLWVFDLADPSVPRAVSRVAEVGPLTWVKPDLGSLLALDRAQTGPVWLQALDLTDPEAPAPAGRLRLPMLDYPSGDTFDIVRGVLWLAVQSSGHPSELVSYDVSRLVGPRTLGRIAFEPTIQAFALDDERAYVILDAHVPGLGRSGCSLAAIDVGDPAAPREVGRSAPARCRAEVVAASGDLVAVGGDEAAGASVLLFDVARPETPVLVGTASTFDVVDSLRFDRDVLWASANCCRGNVVSAIGVSEPTRPLVFGHAWFDDTVRLAPPPGPVMVTGAVDAGHGVGLQILSLP